MSSEVPFVFPKPSTPVFAKIEYYQSHALRYFLYITLCIVTGGTFAIYSTWYPAILTRIARKRTEEPQNADYVLIQGTAEENWSERPVKREILSGKGLA
jgi:hypothetical protein